VKLHFKERAMERRVSSLRWWKDNQKRFPLVSQVVKMYLTILITSFSTAGLTVTRLRSCLTPKHVNILMFLNKMLHFLAGYAKYA